MAYIRGAPEQRFWAKVDKNGPVPEHRPELGPCWLWTAGRFTRGYGCFYNAGRMVKAHRFAYEALVGPVPDGLEPDHLCRRRECVNPAHLEPVTHAENVRRGTSGAQRRSQTHCRHGHAFTTENTRVSEGKRVCIQCARRRCRESYHRHKRDRK